MEQIKKSDGFLNELANIADQVQKIFNGKTSLVIELKEPEYNSILVELTGSVTNEQFKIEISGTDFIFLKDV
jgi:hypothetical protein